MSSRTVYRRGRPILQGLRYRGREGMFAWLLHRASGLGLLLFLLLHVFDIFLLGFGPDIFDAMLFIYKAWWARIMTVLLLFGLVFHALNGARIIIQDSSPRLWRYERQLIWAETAILLPIMIWGSYIMLRPLFAS